MEYLLVASTPSKTLDGTDVANYISGLQSKYGSSVIKMAFDWAGSSNAHPEDAQLFSNCVEAGKKLGDSSSDRTQVMDELGASLTKTTWWHNYVGGIKSAVKLAAQSERQCLIYLGCVAGGPISQYEEYSMHSICKDAISDVEALKKHGAVNPGTSVRVVNFFNLDELTNFVIKIAPLTPDPAVLAVKALKVSLVGEWKCTNPNDYWGGSGNVEIFDNLQYIGHGKGTLCDGLVRIMNAEKKEFNLRRTVEGGNDHIFILSDDGLRMDGHCPQSGFRFTLLKVVKPAPKLDDPEKLNSLRELIVGKWQRVSGDAYFGGDGVVTVYPDLRFSGHGHGKLNDGLVRIANPDLRTFNFRRTIAGANDHIFKLSEDGKELTGSCWNSNSKWLMRRA
eukprot:TRINITY_DN37758_c0_g1_i1.p1 TRINITY_DN37758_c0_g1~~TRINITY_DN37758_c0_g1_i1.p1  ORF type:complete len:392 (-),score=73.02 TRINITY_DN37758_c0_g1_i1:353-1528(-)